MSTYRSPHLAELISHELDARGWDRDYLALRMLPLGDWGDAEAYGRARLSLDFLLDLRDARLVLCDVIAGGLSRAFGVGPGFFVAIHESWRAQAHKEKEPGGNPAPTSTLPLQ